MPDNYTDVILLTRDAQLQGLIARHRPPTAKLRCLAPSDLREATPPAAAQWWVDLDCAARPDIGPCQRRIYFYSKPPPTIADLPTGLYLRKPCPAAVASVLWAGVATGGQPPEFDPESRRRRPALLPSWLLDLHELELQELCHKCVELLPERLGYAESALYLHNAEQNVLTLAETNTNRRVDLAIPLVAGNAHPLAVVASTGKLLITPDLLQACRTRGMACPDQIQEQPDRAALLAPLIARGRLRGMLFLWRRHATELSEVALPLEHLFAFVASCLEHARRYHQARIEARVDPLTGLFNYRWLIESLGQEISRSQRYASALALIMIDVDGLKSVNDRFGHPAGDALLRHTAGKINAALRQIDSAARIGGDEFVVVLPSTDLNGARQAAQRILSAIRADGPVLSGKRLPVAASIGVSQWQAGWDALRLVQAADRAMYQAKREGHNRVAYNLCEQATDELSVAT